MPFRVKKSLLGWIALAVLNCAIIVPFINRHWLPPHDFGVFYTAANVYLHEPPAKLYDLNVQMKAQKEIYGIPDNQLAKRFLPYNHLPYEVVLYLPLARFSPERAFLIWRLENAVLFVFTLWLFAQTFPMQRGPAETFLIALAFFPVPYCFLAGQDTFVTLALFAIGSWLIQGNRNFLAGVALGLCLFKFQLVVPIIGIFFLRRSWKVVAGFASSGAMVLFISALMVGNRGLGQLFRLWVQGENGGIACINPLTMPNIRGLLACIPGLPSNLVTIATVVISLALLFVVTYQATLVQTPTYLFAVDICFVVLVSFHTNLYDLAILILPIMVLLETAASLETSPWVAKVPLVLLFCPLTYLMAFAAFRIALLSLVVASLWFALAVAKESEASIATASASLPELVVLPNLAGASRP